LAAGGAGGVEPEGLEDEQLQVTDSRRLTIGLLLAFGLHLAVLLSTNVGCLCV
jgi:hypothetical protein